MASRNRSYRLSFINRSTSEDYKRKLEEVVHRARLYEKAFGTMLLSRGTEGEGLLPDALYITPEEVKAHIGLTTNVYPDKTDAQWRKEFMESWEREVEWRILKEKND